MRKLLVVGLVLALTTLCGCGSGDSEGASPPSARQESSSKARTGAATSGGDAAEDKTDDGGSPGAVCSVISVEEVKAKLHVQLSGPGKPYSADDSKAFTDEGATEVDGCVFGGGSDESFVSIARFSGEESLFAKMRDRAKPQMTSVEDVSGLGDEAFYGVLTKDADVDPSCYVGARNGRTFAALTVWFAPEGTLRSGSLALADKLV